MDSIEQTSIVIEEDVAKRLAALTGEGSAASDLANDVLRSFAEEVEGAIDTDTAEDERRLREYERTGEAIPWEDFQAHLQDLIAQSEEKMKA